MRPSREALESRSLLTSIVDLGALAYMGGFGGTDPRSGLLSVDGVNATGQVAGTFWDASSGDYQGVVLDGGKTAAVGPPSGSRNSFAMAINDSGQVAGYSMAASDPAGTGAGFLDSNGSLMALPALSGSVSIPAAVDSAGAVVGYSSTSASLSSPEHAVLWSAGQSARDLGTLGGTSSRATGINDSGVVVGYSTTTTSTSSPTVAFVYSDNKTTPLGTLTGAADSYATAINNEGQIVGDSILPPETGFGDAFLYSNGTMTDLGTIGGAADSYATAINDLGQVVGYTGELVGSTSYQAFIYTDGQMTDLNRYLPAGSGWTLQTATGINDQGAVVGTGVYNGTPSAYLLFTSSATTPTPTPTGTPTPTPTPTPTGTTTPTPTGTGTPTPSPSPSPSPTPTPTPTPIGLSRPARTRTILRARPRTVRPGRAVTLTATVRNLTRSGGTPGGLVIFLDGGTELGSVDLQNGRATLTTSALHPGANVMRAEYRPAGDFRAGAATVVERVRAPRSRPKVMPQTETSPHTPPTGPIAGVARSARLGSVGGPAGASGY